MHRTCTRLLTGLVVLFLFAPLSTAQVRVVVTASPGSAVSSAIGEQPGQANLLTDLLGQEAVWRRVTDNAFVSHDIHRTLVVTYPDTASATAAIDRLRLDSQIKSAQFSRLYTVDGTVELRADEPFADSTGHLEIINALQGWNVTTGSREVRIAVVDTGIDFEHPDFQGQFWINPGEDLNNNGLFDASDVDGVDNDANGLIDDIRGYDFVDRSEILNEGDYRSRDYDASDDGSGHGTYVSGIVSAAQNGTGISGVIPGASLVPLRAFSADGNGSDIDIASAIIYAADQGYEVINLSFGDVYESHIMRNAIDYAAASGSVIVASAGNNGGDAPHYPSDYPDVISVVWLNAEGTGQASRATHGVGIDVGAPGTAVFTTRQPFDTDNPSEDDLYARVSGSSMAAPMVSGAAALIKSILPDATPQMVRDVIVSSASDIGSPGWDHTTASGLLNIGRALGSTLSSRVEILSPDNNSGYQAGTLEIIGSVIHPDLASWNLQYIPGDSGQTDVSWTDIQTTSNGQVYNEIVGMLPLDQLNEGLYTLRLRVELADGRDIEDRRRFFVDRTSPQIEFRMLGHAVVDGLHGFALDAETDDQTTVRVQVGGSETSIESDRLSTRHGLTWADQSRVGGNISVSVVAENTAGLVTSVDTTIVLPANAENSELFTTTDLEIPSGFLLEKIVDFDNDGLGELVFNRFEGGWIGDTLLVAEYDGLGFRRTYSIVANVFPRDAGDSDGDGLLEILGQVGPASLILEQASSTGYPSEALLVDTTGISNPSAQNAVWAAGFLDIDGDGRDEVISHNTMSIRILEVINGAYVLKQEIANPTSVTNSELGTNAFEQPTFLKGDFDGDGLDDILLGDADGDWLMLEENGSGSVQVSWSYETDRYGAATRFGSGDFDGDGVDDFVTYTRNWLPATGRNDQEPDFGTYYFWRSVGDNDYELEYELTVPGLIDRYGAIASIDADNDGDDETVIIDSPSLVVLDRLSDGSRQLVYVLDGSPGEEASGPHSPRIVSGTFDGSSDNAVVYADANGRMAMLRPKASGSLIPPTWISAVPGGPETAKLQWYHPSADSFAVYRALSGTPYEMVAAVAGTSYTDSTLQLSEYFVQAIQNGELSPAGKARSVLPHSPADIVEVAYRDSTQILISFDYPLDATINRHQLQLSDGSVARTLLLSDGGKTIVSTFDADAAALSDTLFFLELDDRDLLRVSPEWIQIDFPSGPSSVLVLRSWNVEAPDRVRLSFSKPVDPVSAGSGSFSIQPVGTVVSVDIDPAEPKDVIVTLEGINLAASGVSPLLIVNDLSATDGSLLAAEGNTIRLFVEPTGLDNVVVYPNPLDLRIHDHEAHLAGLPAGTGIDILAVDGALVASLPVTENSGEIKWDLRDRSGALVASGVYLLKFTEASGRQAFRKLVVVR